MSGHTPGTWEASGATVWAWAAKDRGDVARCGYLDVSMGEQHANAALIARAPGLLARVEALEAVFRADLAEHAELQHCPCRFCARARTLLAEGKEG